MKTLHIPLSGLLFLSLLWPTGSIAAAECPGLFPPYRRSLRHLPPERLRAFFYRADTREKIVALTFDDGPLRRTPNLLRLLKKEKVPATFFLLASRLDARNARLYDDPLFRVALHGWRHRRYDRLSARTVARELDRGLKRFRRVGLRTEWFRPPYGMVSASLPRLLKERGLRGVLWSLDSYDWRGVRGERVTARLRTLLRPGAVILLHDQSLPLRDLARLIGTIRRRGYRIVPLKRLMEFPSLSPAPLRRP